MLNEKKEEQEVYQDRQKADRKGAKDNQKSYDDKLIPKLKNVQSSYDKNIESLQKLINKCQEQRNDILLQ